MSGKPASQIAADVGRPSRRRYERAAEYRWKPWQNTGNLAMPDADADACANLAPILLETRMSFPLAGNLHALLRDVTKGPHRALDSQRFMAPLMRDDLTVEQYGKCLAALHSVFAPLETGIDFFLTSSRVIFNYDSRRKKPALEEDLAALGLPPLRKSMSYPVPSNMGELVGVLYVVEGSTKGGQHILRHLRKFENLPTQFFSGYGEHTETRWTEFLDFADAACIESDHHHIAAKSAVSLFHAIKAHLDECD